jgi:hypothetical protein
MYNKERIDALPVHTATLQAMVLNLQDQVASLEEGKRLRAQADADLAAGAGADFAGELLDVKAALEGLADGSEDYTDPRERQRITKAATGLLDRIMAALQAK